MLPFFLVFFVAGGGRWEVLGRIFLVEGRKGGAGKGGWESNLAWLDV